MPQLIPLRIDRSPTPTPNNAHLHRINHIVSRAVHQIKQSFQHKSLIYRIVFPLNRASRTLSNFKKIEPRLAKYRLQELLQSDLLMKRNKENRKSKESKNSRAQSRENKKARVKSKDQGCQRLEKSKSQYATTYGRTNYLTSLCSSKAQLVVKPQPLLTNPLRVPPFAKFYSTFLHAKTHKLTLA